MSQGPRPWCKTNSFRADPARARQHPRQPAGSEQPEGLKLSCERNSPSKPERAGLVCMASVDVTQCDTIRVCGLRLKSKDRKVWQQAIAMLMDLKVRNGLGEKELVGAVERALAGSNR